MDDDNVIPMNISNKKNTNTVPIVDLSKIRFICQLPVINKIFLEKLKALEISFAQKISELPKIDNEITVSIPEELYHILIYLEDNIKIKESIQAEILIKKERDKLRKLTISG